MARALVRYPGAGCLVEFLQGNEIILALVLDEQGGRLRLLLPNRREMNLQANRLLPWSGPQYALSSSKDDGIALLEKHRAKRFESRKLFDALGLWELAQGEVEKATAAWFAELVLTDPDVDSVAACGHELLDCKSHFKFQPPEFEIFSQEVAEKRQKESDASQAREKIAQQGTAWFAQLWDMHVKKQVIASADLSLRPEESVSVLLEDLLLKKMLEPENQANDTLWRLLTKKLPDDPYLPLYLATAWGLVPKHYDFWLARADYDPGDAWTQEYSSSIEDLVRLSQQAVDPSFPTLPMEYPQADLKELVSIDASTTRDIDDAFAVTKREKGGWCVSIALACPALHWPFTSPLDKAVFYRSTSLYLPEATYHMMPEALGTGAFSLHEKQEKPALLLHCSVSADGALEECFMECKTVCLAANSTYEAVQAFFDNPDSGHCCPESLYEGLQLAKARQASRIGRGAVIIERPEPHIVAEALPNGDYSVRLEEDIPALDAHLVVGELMILANAAIGRWAHEHALPLLYRTQHLTVPKEFAGIWREPHDIARVVRALAPATLETQPKPHAGVGESYYAPTTSPLRRYPDLVNETQILSMLRTGKPMWSQTELDTLLAELGQRLDAAQQVQRFRSRYWKLLYVARQGDKRWWSAVITDEGDQYVGISLPKEQLLARGKKSLFGTRTRPGQQIEVRLHKVHPLLGEYAIAETREPQHSETTGAV